MLQKNRKLAHLASARSLSRCFVVRYMRWATSSMAHSLKNRPRFISVRISNLKRTESMEFNLTGDRKGLEGPCIRQKLTIKNKIKILSSAQHFHSVLSFTHIALITATIVVGLSLCEPFISIGPEMQREGSINE